MDLTCTILNQLQPGHSVIAIGHSELLENDSNLQSLLALIKTSEDGTDVGFPVLLIFKAGEDPLDMILFEVLMVDHSLNFQIDQAGDAATHLNLNFTLDKRKLSIQMPFGCETETFVSEFLRIKDLADKAESQYGYNSLSFYKIGDMVIRMDESITDGTFPPTMQKAMRKTREIDYRLKRLPSGMSSNPLAARESQINHQMSQKEKSYTDLMDVKVFIGTWNVNGQAPSVGLSQWLSADDEPPDIYAVAFQELDLSKEVFLFNATPREQEWVKAVLNGLHPKSHYRKVRHVRLIGMMLIVLVQEKHYAYVRNVAMDTVGTGIMNKLGNKGAVSIRMDFHNTSICFVNPHMAAHVEEFERRNEDHDDIFKRTVFNINSINGQPKTIREHNQIYFFGDMNYRISPGFYDVRELASQNDFSTLLQNDQLSNQKACGRIFEGFEEGIIDFKPTFKYDLYTDIWDSSEKGRQPAWCDRVLWKGEGIEQTVYRSHPMLNISDHKPVSGLFTAKINVIDSLRYRKVYEEVMKELDKIENDALPQVVVRIASNPSSKENEIILDPVRFLQPQTKEIIVENTGQVPATFEFIKKLNEDTPCRPWLTIRPCMRTLSPYERCVVSFEVLVDKRTAPQLNTGADKLYDILVLHLDGGKDIFITIVGEYIRSCFGSSINALVHMTTPFKDVAISRLLDLESRNPTMLSEMPHAIPKELWYLIDHIHEHGMQVEGLFTSPGLRKEITEVISALDAGAPDRYLPGSVLSVAEVLLLFLEASSEPVLPNCLYGPALEATQNFALCKEVIDKLPDHHRNVFNYLMAFLKELLIHSDANNLDAKTLAHAFGSVLIRSPAAATRKPYQMNPSDERKKDTFIHHFLVNDYD